jgi:hypothetical protein
MEEAVRRTLAEIGEAPAPEVAAFVERRYGVKLDPKLLPVIRATLRSRQQLEEARARARAKALTAEQAKAVTSQPT